MRQPEGKIQIGRPRRRCEDKSEVYLKGIRCESVDWIHLDHHRIYWGDVVKIFMILRV